MTKQFFGAIALQNGKYAVGRATLILPWKPVGDIREFGTFEEADEVAQAVSAGKYEDLAGPGQYVNMR